MTVRQHYAKAPIIEAVIELQVVLPEGVSASQLEEIQRVLPTPYPSKKKMVTWTSTVEVQPDQDAPHTEASQQHTGYRFESEDGRRILQVRLGAFAFSVLTPYDRWETFRDEARLLWDAYTRLYNPLRITRTAVRYINRIDIPFNVEPTASKIMLEHYVKIYPEVSVELPHDTMDGFFMQLQIPQPDIDAMLIVNEARVPPASPKVLSFVLDFDLFSDRVWEMEEERRAWEYLEELHTRKNAVFEASITDATRELIR